MKRLFLVTGVSTGLGRALASACLERGHTVAGTLRSEDGRAEFDALSPGRSFGVLLDVTETDAVRPLVDRIEREIGPIDVLVNNAGYGLEGTIEETPLADQRHQFDVNVFGAIAMIQSVLPHMRKRRSGHIINITSIGGMITRAGLGAYHASKFALEGYSGTLRGEVAGLGIKVTAVEPGGFRTDWAGRSMARAARTVSDYDEVFEAQRKARLAYNGHQPGDPAKAARAILTLVESASPPAHLLLGSDAFALAQQNLEVLKAEFDAWRTVSLSTDFD
ncbi:oxidoreductase [Microbaculum marinum]|uniref:Oxidoreductase n=1 Tax=Microbaculum marinum TaxID=1764581 RepID=A0AAW9RT62_9HYPH